MLVIDNPPAGDPSRDWYLWRIADDERTCPVCAPLHNRLINGEQGPFPPLHTNCRCWLVYSHSDPAPPSHDVDEPLLPPASPGVPGPF
jgi:hypothetical protein